jgi:hydroxyacylglutathione hydrolase
MEGVTRINLITLPAFTDNYIWLLHDGHAAVVVDPGDSAPVLDALDRLGLVLAHILVTHHHHDHIDGVQALRSRLQGQVWGPADEALPPPWEHVVEGQVLPLLGVRFEVMRVPGHTLGHLAYLATHPEWTEPTLFCGDTLFSAGCGRLFEGTPAQMFASLSRLAALPPSTRVCCTHEYTVSNLRFAQAVEPRNEEIAAHLRHSERLRSADTPTLPSTISVELRVNPYLRCTEPDVIASALRAGATGTEPLAVFTALREWKNRFR